MTVADVLEFLIAKCPGRTELELAKAIFGEHAVQQRVNQDIALLVNRDVVIRKGEGGQSDPYRLFPSSMQALRLVQD